MSEAEDNREHDPGQETNAWGSSGDDDHAEATAH